MDLNDIILNRKNITILDDTFDDGLWVGPNRAWDDCKPNAPNDHALKEFSHRPGHAHHWKL